MRESGVAAFERDPEDSVGFLRGGARPPTQPMIDYIDANKDEFGVQRKRVMEAAVVLVLFGGRLDPCTVQ